VGRPLTTITCYSPFLARHSHAAIAHCHAWRASAQDWRTHGLFHVLAQPRRERGRRRCAPQPCAGYALPPFAPKRSTNTDNIFLFAGALELVDVSDQLPELKRRPGLTTWEVTRTHSVHAHVRCKLIITSLNVVCQVFDMNKPRKRNKAEEEAEIKWAPGWYSAHDALPSRSKKFIHASCFPPANAKDLHLERWYAYLFLYLF